MLIARLIAEQTNLSAHCDAAIHAIEGQGGRIARFGAARHDQTVQELAVEGMSMPALRQVIDQAFGPTDHLITDHAPVVPTVFVSDMDSTMIGQECIDELADFAGLKDQVAAITERAMQGELDFAQALTERVRLLEGLDEGAIEQCLDERIRAVPGAQTLVATLRRQGCRTVLVTGGFHQFADPVARQLGFEEVVGNRLAVVDGRLTGGLVGGIVDSAVKRQVLEDQVGRAGGGPSLATGDGANDVPMLVSASYGLAYRAKPRARAAANGAVDRGDLTSVLRLVGIAQSDWA